MNEDILKRFSSKREKYLKDIFESDCVYIKSMKEWVGKSFMPKLKIKEDTLGATPKLLVNVAKSSASKCRICGFPIEKGNLRIGYPSKDPRGNHGYISCWVHLLCSKHLIFSVLYNENNRKHLDKYLNATEILLIGENYNIYELNIYNQINLDMFFGGFSELGEEERKEIRNAIKPYELMNKNFNKSIDVFVHEEKEKISTRLNSFNVETIIKPHNFTTPEELNCTLLCYQKEGVAWMINQENLEVKGGILADEMGMGKTIQAIALLIYQKKMKLKKEMEEIEKKKKKEIKNDASEIHSVIEILSSCEEDTTKENVKTEEPSNVKGTKESNVGILSKRKSKSKSKSVKEEKELHQLQKHKHSEAYPVVEHQEEKNDDKKLMGGTLIVAPVAAVMQWKTEIEKFVKNNFLKTYIYHDSSRNIPIKKLLDYDVVITSYPTIEVPFRNIVNKHKMSCQYCGRLFLPRTLVAHQKYFCGPTATRTEKLKKRKKKNKEGALVAMKKFDDNFVPTPRNVLMEIMKEAQMENTEAAKVIDVDKAFEIANKAHQTINKIKDDKKKGNEKGKRKSKQIDNKTDIDKKKGKNKIESDVEIIEKSENLKNEKDENSSSDNALFSPLSRKTSSRMIDLCNLGFDKSVIQKNIEKLYKKHKSKKKNWNLIIKKVLENDKEQLEMNSKCTEIFNKIYLTDEEICVEDLKKLNMGELKVILIAMGKHVFGTKIELMNRVLVSGKYIRQELHKLENGMHVKKDISDDESHMISITEKKKNASYTINVKKEQAKDKKSFQDDDIIIQTRKSKMLRKSEHINENNMMVEINKKNVIKGKVKKEMLKKETPQKNETGTGYNKKSLKKRKRSFVLDTSSSNDDSDVTFSESELMGNKQWEKINKKRNNFKKVKRKKAKDDDEVEENSSDDNDEDYDYDDESESETIESDASYDSIYVRKGMSKNKKLKKGKVKMGEDGIDLTESPLHKIMWNRIILDEAHRIKNRTTSTTQSILNLNCSGSRWCLTGTPLQNRIGELFSLIRFLEFYPYAYYFCSKTKCKCLCLNYNIKDNRFCTICKHTKLSHFNYFNKRILKPMQQFGYSGEGTNSMVYLKEEVLDKILLRRTKTERQSDVKLKPLIITIRKDKLSEEEKDFYESLYKQTSTQFDIYVKANTVLHNYAHIFDLLSRLRQAADHPYLIIFGNTFLKDPSGKFIKKNAEIVPAISSAQVCGICLENISRQTLVQTKCKHDFHKACLKQYLESFDLNTLGEEEKQTTDNCIMMKEIQHLNSHNEVMTNGNIKNKDTEEECILVENDSSFKKFRTSGCLNKDDELIIKQTEELKHKAKTISHVKFKDREKSEFVSLLNNDENVKQYPAGCPICFIPLTLDNSILYEIENGNDDMNYDDEEEEIVTAVKEEEKNTYSSKSIINRINTEEFKTSTKINAVFEEVQKVIKNTDDKCLVFSQYCSMLDLIEYQLKKNNIICSKLLGYMSMKSRNNILYSFNKDKQLRVLLISLKAGGEGLNLQVANRIFIVDPWWNPAAELQAIQRAHRIGQTKNVYAIRFIIENTVEEKMIQLQKKKQLVFDCTIGGSNEAMQKLTKEDLAFLFQE